MYACTCPGSLTLFVLIGARPPDEVSFFITIIYDPVFFVFQREPALVLARRNALSKFKCEDLKYPPPIKVVQSAAEKGLRKSICEIYDQQQSLARKTGGGERGGSPTGGKRIDRRVKK